MKTMKTMTLKAFVEKAAMTTLVHLGLGLMLLAGSAISVQAQTGGKPSPKFGLTTGSAIGVRAQTPATVQAQTPWVTATASPEQVRYTAPAAVYQMRLEVLSSSGERLYDSEFKFGNLLDWPLQDQQGRRLSDGLYRCVVTIKDFSGQTGQRRGMVSLQAGAVALQQPERGPFTIREANSLATIDRYDFWTSLDEGAAGGTTLLAHDGDNGRLVVGRGALSFRTGDFFAGKDVERMRLTEEGNLGIGVENPQAKLDVGGVIRTGSGIMFPDGTIQTTAAADKRAAREVAASEIGPSESGKMAVSGPLAVGGDGSGIPGTIPFWISRSNIGNSIIQQSSDNKIGIGRTANFNARLIVEGGNLDSAVWGVGGNVGVRGHGPHGVVGFGNIVGVIGFTPDAGGFGGRFSNGAGGTALRVDGLTSTSVLQITNGSDLSEQFDVKASLDSDSDASPRQVQPGLVVSIDPDNPGKLVVSSQAYDRRVAGIISGAGGVNPGMLMGQSGSVADGSHPVALTGRVYCWADASDGPINPGDLLTTSTIPGHAMKVADHIKSQGAIIGKAMSSLKKGQGLVLVLVTLQ